MCYPQRQQQQQQHFNDNNDDHQLSEISLREVSLLVALAFIKAARCNALHRLNTLHLTSVFTGQWTTLSARQNPNLSRPKPAGSSLSYVCPKFTPQVRKPCM